tara:strand:- start:1119 stop:3254 length:2136 start_codon:yes stop_codon:yes gene_type:complete
MSSIDKKSILIAIISVSFLISSSSLLPSKEGLENNSPNPYHSDSNSSPIHGHSFLNFTAPISHNSQINATWYAEVSVQESYGTELLDNRSLGLLVQIDSILGNSDGWIDVEESNEFAGLVASARNWTDAYSGGCCSFDYSSMQVSGERQLTVVPPETGPVNRSEGHWGWTESANLSGLSDGRVLRLLDLPRVGAMIEEVPISIGLPEGWEFKFSPMSEIIHGNPGGFTVNRSEAPVAYDIRITIGENIPPTMLASRFPSSSTTSLNLTSSFSASCNDSPLDSPIIHWEVLNEGEVVYEYQNPWFEISPSEIGLSHGDVLSVNASCTDFHGATSHWNDHSLIDGIGPDWSGTITANGTEARIIEIHEDVIEVLAGTELQFDINGSDESMLPVFLEMFTNISEGWRQFGMFQHMFHFTAIQGSEVNGAHLPLNERHIQRSPTEISVLLLVTDDAGNSAMNEWVVRVLDSSPPTVIPRLFSNDVEIEFDEAHEGDELTLDLSHSFDDLDDINDVLWSVWADGTSPSPGLPELLIAEANWTEAESITLPMLSQGQHEIIVSSTDSKGNHREEVVDIVILPKRGAHISVIDASFSDGAQVGSMATLVVVVQNEGSDDAFARVCLSDICGRWTEQPFSATLESGPALRTIEFQFEMLEESIDNLTLHWDSAPAGTNGEIALEVQIESGKGGSGTSMLPILVIIAILSISYYLTRSGD